MKLTFAALFFLGMIVFVNTGVSKGINISEIPEIPNANNIPSSNASRKTGTILEEASPILDTRGVKFRFPNWVEVNRVENPHDLTDFTGEIGGSSFNFDPNKWHLMLLVSFSYDFNTGSLKHRSKIKKDNHSYYLQQISDYLILVDQYLMHEGRRSDVEISMVQVNRRELAVPHWINHYPKVPKVRSELELITNVNCSYGFHLCVDNLLYVPFKDMYYRDLALWLTGPDMMHDETTYMRLKSSDEPELAAKLPIAIILAPGNRITFLSGLPVWWNPSEEQPDFISIGQVNSTTTIHALAKAMNIKNRHTGKGGTLHVASIPVDLVRPHRSEVALKNLNDTYREIRGQLPNRIKSARNTAIEHLREFHNYQE